MKKTVGDTDKLVRIILGAVAGLASIGILVDMVPGPELASPVLGLVAIILLVTAFTGMCPIFSALGISTRK